MDENHAGRGASKKAGVRSPARLYSFPASAPALYAGGMAGDSGTLGYLIDSRTQLRIYCDDCRYNGWLDLEAAAKKFGRDHSYLAPDLLPKLWCPKCKGTRLEMRVHPFTGGAGSALAGSSN